MLSARRSTRRPSCSGSAIPAGQRLSVMAAKGRATIKLPRPMLGRDEPHFSLAGLKTALRHEAMARAPLSEQDIADLCASFQEAVADILSRQNVARLRALRGARGTGRATHPRRRRRRRRQSKAEIDAGSDRAEAHLPPGRAAARALHRQCRHDRLGGRHAACARADRRSFGARPRALAARSRRAARARRRRQGLRRLQLTSRQSRDPDGLSHALAGFRLSPE